MNDQSSFNFWKLFILYNLNLHTHSIIIVLTKLELYILILIGILLTSKSEKFFQKFLITDNDSILIRNSTM